MSLKAVRDKVNDVATSLKRSLDKFNPNSLGKNLYSNVNNKLANTTANNVKSNVVNNTRKNVSNGTSSKTYTLPGDLNSPQCFTAGTLVKTELGNKEIQDIQVGDKVYARNVVTGKIDIKEVTRRFINEVNVYNFEVYEYHTYYVADIGVLVHNTCPKPQRWIDAEAKLQKSDTGDIGPTIDKNTGYEVGTIFVDPKGNAMISPKGGGINPTGTGYRGMDMETLYSNGSVYQRNNPNGHASMPGQNHGHGHLLGTGPGKRGAGPSIDINGNVVPFYSSAAHWPTK